MAKDSAVAQSVATERSGRKKRTTNASRGSRPPKDGNKSPAKKSRRFEGSGDNDDRTHTKPTVKRSSRFSKAAKAVIVVLGWSMLRLLFDMVKLEQSTEPMRDSHRSVSPVDRQSRGYPSDSSGGRSFYANDSTAAVFAIAGTAPAAASIGAAIDRGIEQSDQTFIEVWHRLKRHLCPSGSLLPNTENKTIGQELFRLAREEVLKDPAIQRIPPLDEEGKVIFSNITKTHSERPQLIVNETIQKFFAGDFNGGTVGVIKTTTIANAPANGDTKLKTNISHASSAVTYIRIWKCGNNQIREWFQSKFASDITSLPMPPHTNISAAYIRDRVAYNRFQSMIGRLGTTVNKNATTVESFTAHPPCIVTAIRDPIEHFLSGYNEFENIEIFCKQRKPQQGNAKALLPYCQSGQGTIDRFKRFVWYILHGPFIVKASYRFSHVFPMSRVLSVLHKHGLQLDGYLPTLHNILHVWPDFVGRTCQRSFPQSTIGENRKNVPTLSPLPEGKGQHKSSKDPFGTYQAAKDAWKEQGPVSRALCLLHAYDYACWELLPGGVPLLCQDVYMSDAFRAIFGE